MHQEAVQQAKAELTRSRNRMLTLLHQVPEDRLNWSPAPTARTPVQLVGHSAKALHSIADILGGGPLPDFSDIANLDSFLRSREEDMTSKDAAAALLRTNADEYFKVIEGMSDERLAGTVPSPFGPMPMTFALRLGAIHTDGHIAQMEYLQTIWGDRDWYLFSQLPE